MIIQTKYCDYCGYIVRLTEDGYCPECGKHADNMLDPHNDPDDQYDKDRDYDDNDEPFDKDIENIPEDWYPSDNEHPYFDIGGEG